ncbi:MAG: tetratricopeptide repeat protein, partial [Aggregatilineales bacterium]
FQRVIRGDYSYNEDTRALQRYQKQAQKLNAKSLEARILSCFAILQNISGRTTEAAKQLQEVYEIYEELADKEYMAKTLCNLAVIHNLRGNYEEAITLCEKALTLISVEENYTVYRFLLDNRMNLAFHQQDYTKVDELYLQIQAILTEFGNDNKQDYARCMSRVYQVMAERELIRQNYQQAKGYINLATEFAEGLSLTFRLTKIYCTHARIALKQSNNRELAEHYWQKTHETFQIVQSPSHIGRHYIEEARYLMQHGYPDKAREFAQYAMSIFEQLEMPEDITLAGQLLHTIQEGSEQPST